jgi:hypothetical protein
MKVTRLLGALLLKLLEAYVDFDNLRPSGALRWKVEDHWLERMGSVLWQAGTSKGVAPLVSVKDRWVDPCEKVLNVLIACL